MITVFRVSDAIRCIVSDSPNTANLAAPTELIIRCRPLRNYTFWAESLGRSPNRVTVGDWNGITLGGLASARIRSGIRSWEIDRLHLNDFSQALELLEQAAYSAGLRGAERLFLRVPLGSELFETARNVGFFPYFNEIHLVGVAPALNTEVNGFSVEHRTQADLQGLFQLYCAVTPHEIRQAIGMTIDQWRDSQEPARTHRDESILKLDGQVVGWQTSDRFGKSTAGQALGHPGHPDAIRYLVDISSQTQNWLVPNYQENVAELLSQRGLQEFRRYTMLIKKISVPVRNREFSYVEA